MRPLRKTLFAALLATLTIWIITEWRGIVFTTQDVGIWCGQGCFQVVYDPGVVFTMARSSGGPGFAVVETYPFTWFAGFEIDENAIDIPLWAVFALLLLPWLILTWKHRLDQKVVAVGCCSQCGYDLTGNESGICSECGHDPLQES